MIKRSCLALASGLVAFIVSTSSAVPLTVGQSSLAVSEVNPVGGTVLATAMTPFATANYTGWVTSKVIQGDTSNALGGLTFTYSLLNNPGSSNAITRFTITGYNAYATDASYQFGTGAVAPSLMDRNTSDVMGFSFVGTGSGLPFPTFGVIMDGQTSETLVIQTNALDYVYRIGNVSNGAVSPANVYGPAGGITPEPASIAALAGLGMVFRRRR